MKNKWLAFIVLLLISLDTFSQEKRSSAYYFQNDSITKIFDFLELEFDVKFSYQNDLLEGKVIALNVEGQTLTEILYAIEALLEIDFSFINQRYISVTKRSSLQEVLLEDIIVTGYLTSGISKSKNGSFKLDTKKLNVLPGLTEADVLESIQLLPSVTSPHETATGFNVRGGRADQNRIIWDGINIYHKGHLFGMISPFNPISVEQVTFVNKGTNPRFGERLSSVISIQSKGSIAQEFSGEIGANALSFSAAMELPIITDQLSVHGAVRRSYAEAYESLTLDQMANKVFQNTKIANEESTNNDFYYLDYNLRVNYKPSAKDKFSISMLQIDNGLDYLVKDLDRQESFNDILSIKNEGYSANWSRVWSQKIKQETHAFLSKYRFSYNLIEQDSLGTISNFDKRNVIFDSGFGTEVSMDLGTKNRLTAGYQYTLKDVAYAFLDSAALDFVLDTDKTVEISHAVFSNFSYKNPDFMDFDIGGRVNYYERLNAVRLEPRFSAYKKLNNYWKLQVTGEVKNQIISEIDETVLSELSLENKIWRLADGETFPIINSLQFSTGFLYYRDGWSIDTDYYYKKINGLTALSLGFLNPLDSQFHIGEQKVLGADLYLKKNLRPFQIWLSYAVNSVDSKYQGINNEKYFTSSNSIIHAVTSSVSYKNKGFQVSLGWNWRSGKPYTKTLENDSSYLVFFDEINAQRLSNYHRLDISSTYDFKISSLNDINAKVGFSVRNLYDRENHLSREYLGNNNLDDPIRVVDNFSLRITPNILFKMYW